MIFRVTYIRNGKKRGITFAKKNLALAVLHAYDYIYPLVRATGGTNLDVNPVTPRKVRHGPRS